MGEKKGVGVIMREKGGRSMEEIKLTREMKDRLVHNKGDILTVKIKEDMTARWVTIVYMEVESQRNEEGNRKLYKAVANLKERVECNK